MIEALLEAIYAAPDDDAPRLVYADALIERGDPRGEFIVRQCGGDPATDLLEQHRARWLGELVPCLRHSTFERGFLTKATFYDPGLWNEVEPVIGHPALRTVRELAGPAVVAVDPRMTALRVLHVPGHRRELGSGARDYDFDYRRELLTGTPREITELHYGVSVRVQLEDDSVEARPIETIVSRDLALADCTALPKLRRLVLRGVPLANLAELLGRSILERIPRVEIHHVGIEIAIAGRVAAITVAPTTRPQVVLAWIDQLPAYLAIELTTGPDFDRRIIAGALGTRLR